MNTKRLESMHLLSQKIMETQYFKYFKCLKKRLLKSIYYHLI